MGGEREENPHRNSKTGEKDSLRILQEMSPSAHGCKLLLR